MAVTLAKLTRPDPGEALLRERLFTQLGAARQQPIIWISAPAGAGKTTLISSYIESQRLKNLWYQVDAGDADMATFFQYLGQAVKSVSRTRKKMPVLTPEYQLGVPEFTRNYFREVFQRLGAPVLLVLDNFQDAGQEADLNKMLAAAFDEIPKGINVIIISRTDPPESFARLRANQQLCLLGWEDIQFTVEEELAITQQRYPHRNITRQQLQKLNMHLQGWVTGLILLLEHGVELDEVEFDREELSQEYLFDYFATEIFQKIDTQIQQFLIKTAILPKMTASICRQLTGNRAASKILSELARKQYFTVRHGVLKPSYEYHPLFRDFLQSRAQENFDEAEYKQLQSRAGLLLADVGDIDYATDLLIQGENWPALSKLILKHTKQQIEDGRNQQVVCWIDALPSELMEQQPWLLYWLGMARLQYENNSARQVFEKAYAKFKDAKDVKGLYLSWCGIADAYIFAFDSFVGADRWVTELDWLQQAYARPLSLEVRGHLAFSAASLLLWMQPGHPDLPVWMGKIETMYRLIPNKVLKILCAMQLCMYYANTGEVEKLRQINNRINRQAFLKEDQPFIMVLAIMIVYASDWITADLKIDNALFDKYHQKIRDKGIKVFTGMMLAHGLYHSACRRDLARCEKLLDMYANDISVNNILEQSHYQVHLCSFEILRGNYDRALEHGKIAVDLTEQAAAPFPVWMTHAVLAYLYVEKDQPSLAQEHLEAVQHIIESMKSSVGIFVSDMIRCYLAFHQHDLHKATKLLAPCFRLGREKDIKATSILPPRMISTLCSLALEHNIEPDYAKSIIRIYQYTPQDSLYVGEHWPWPLKIYTLGRFSVLLNDQPLDTETRPFDLLKVLLAFGGRDVHEEKIMDALWPDAEGDQSQASFKTTLHRLRKVLGDLDILVLKNHQLSLNQQFVWVDTWAMSRLYEPAQQSVKTKDIAQSAELVSKLIQLYRGHFLANEPAGWTIHQREGLRLRFVRHTTALAQSFVSEDSQTAIRCYQRLLAIDPLIEEAYQGLIGCYQAQGRHAEARACYGKCVDVLTSTIGVAPSAATTALMKP